MECNIREVTLWADPDYTSNEVASMESSRERKRELSASEVARPQKKPKADAAVKTEPGKLSEKHLETLTAEKTKLAELYKKIYLTNRKAALPDLEDGITKRDRAQGTVSELRVQATIATVEMSTESGSGNFKDLRKEISAARAEAHCHHSKLKQSIADAERDLTAEALARIQEGMDVAEDSFNS